MEAVEVAWILEAEAVEVAWILKDELTSLEQAWLIHFSLQNLLIACSDLKTHIPEMS